MFVVAYACHPGMGSEEGVGWAWVRHLAEQFDHLKVFVSPGYLDACLSHAPPNVQFLTVNCRLCLNANPASALFLNTFFLKPLIHVMYRRWLNAILRVIDERETLIVVTYVGIRFAPSFSKRSGVTAFAPVGGALEVPSLLINDLSLINSLMLRYRNFSVQRNLRKCAKVMTGDNFIFVPAGWATLKALKAVDLHVLRPVPEIIMRFGEKVPVVSRLPNEPLVLLFCAKKFGELKGASFVVDFLVEYDRRYSYRKQILFEFVIIGTVGKSDRKKLKELSSIKLTLLGSVSRDAVMREMARADVLLHCSYLDLTATVLVEALRFAAVPIVFDTHEMRNTVDQSNGLLINPNDRYVDRIARVIEFIDELQVDREKLMAMKKACRTKASSFDGAGIKSLCEVLASA